MVSNHVLSPLDGVGSALVSVACRNIVLAILPTRRLSAITAHPVFAGAEERQQTTHARDGGRGVFSPSNGG